jgi:TPR repeat protein
MVVATVGGGSARTLRLGLPFALATVMLLALLVGAGYSGPLTPQAQTAQQQNTLTADELKALQQKAEQGDAEAQCTLGFLYRKGQGVPQDDAQALAWTRKAAEQGHAEAQFNLGVFYRLGQGVPLDLREAVKWSTVAMDRLSGDQRKANAAFLEGTARMLTAERLAEAQKRASEWTAAFEKRKK